MSSPTFTGKTAASVRFYAFHGEVMGSKVWSSTQVSGGGGGGSTPVSISSTTTGHEQLILRNASGEEKSFEFQNMTLAVRDGHGVSIIWGIKEGKNTGSYLAALNHNTKDVVYGHAGVKALTQNNLLGCSMLLMGLIGALIVITALALMQLAAGASLGWLFVGSLCIGGFIWFFRWGKGQENQISSTVKSMISEYKGTPTEQLGVQSAQPT